MCLRAGERESIQRERSTEAFFMLLIFENVPFAAEYHCEAYERNNNPRVMKLDEFED